MANRSEDFTKADSASTVNPASDGGANPSALVGTWGIASNHGYNPGADSGALLVWESSASTVDVQFTLTGETNDAGVVAMCSDASNFLLWRVNNSTSHDLYQQVAGSYTALATGLGAYSGTDVLKLSVSGTTAVARVNGTTLTTQSFSAALASNTKHGLRFSSDSNSRASAFSVTDNGGGGAVTGASSLACISTITAGGRVAQQGAGSLTSVSIITAGGRVSELGAAAMSGVCTLASAGKVSELGAAALAAISTLAASGVLGSAVSGLATLASVSTLTASGLALRLGASGLGSTSTLVAGGQVASVLSGSAALAGSSTLTSAGLVSQRGAASLASASTLAAAGALGSGLAGSASLASVATLAASGRLSLAGTARLVGVSTLLARATPPDPPPIPGGPIDATAWLESGLPSDGLDGLPADLASAVEAALLGDTALQSLAPGGVFNGTAKDGSDASLRPHLVFRLASEPNALITSDSSWGDARIRLEAFSPQQDRSNSMAMAVLRVLGDGTRAKTVRLSYRAGGTTPLILADRSQGPERGRARGNARVFSSVVEYSTKARLGNP